MTAHVLQAAEFYTSGDRAVFLNLGKKVWELPPEDLPPQEKMAKYLDEARKKSLAWIDSIGDAGLDSQCPGLLPGAANESITTLERIAYALRHLQHHIGELCAYQKQLCLEPAEWH